VDQKIEEEISALEKRLIEVEDDSAGASYFAERAGLGD